MTKKIIAVLLISFSQFIYSCIIGPVRECDFTGLPSAYEVTYDEVKIMAWNTKGFRNTSYKDSVSKDAFGLSMIIEPNLTEVAYHNTIKKQNYSYGSVLYACSPAEPDYNFLDTLDSAKIFMTNLENNTITDATSLFSTPDYNEGGRISAENTFSNIERTSRGAYYTFDLTDYSNIPDSASFTFNLYLKSGEVLTATTEKIKFI